VALAAVVAIVMLHPAMAVLALLDKAIMAALAGLEHHMGLAVVVARDRLALTAAARQAAGAAMAFQVALLVVLLITAVAAAVVVKQLPLELAA
jgi:hypothetical protein